MAAKSRMRVGRSPLRKKVSLTMPPSPTKKMMASRLTTRVSVIRRRGLWVSLGSSMPHAHLPSPRADPRCLGYARRHPWYISIKAVRVYGTFSTSLVKVCLQNSYVVHEFHDHSLCGAASELLGVEPLHDLADSLGVRTCDGLLLGHGFSSASMPASESHMLLMVN